MLQTLALLLVGACARAESLSIVEFVRDRALSEAERRARPAYCGRQLQVDERIPRECRGFLYVEELRELFESPSALRPSADELDGRWRPVMQAGEHEAGIHASGMSLTFRRWELDAGVAPSLWLARLQRDRADHGDVVPLVFDARSAIIPAGTLDSLFYALEPPVGRAAWMLCRAFEGDHLVCLDDGLLRREPFFYLLRRDRD